MASSPLVSPPQIDTGILDRLTPGATKRPMREAALTLASAPMLSTPTNRYWRIDFARLDLRIDAPRPLAAPTYSLPAELAIAGAIFCSLADAAQRHPEIVAQYLGVVIPSEESRFTALTAALEQSGYFLYIPAQLKLSTPLSITIEVGIGTLCTPRNLIILEEHSSAILHEVIIGKEKRSDEETLLCGTVEVVLGQGAELSIVTQQLLDEAAACFMTRRTQLGPEAKLNWALLEFGGALVHSRLDAHLAGADAESDLTAICFPHAKQHVDLSTEVIHSIPNTTSHTTVKVAAKDHGQGRYSGNIRIEPGAHGSSAMLRDDSLLLSANAHIDSIPALEIAANDVQAYHGATVGAIDDEIRFYLMSRGIPAQEAERILALAFFEPALVHIHDTAEREQIGQRLAYRVGTLHAH